MAVQRYRTRISGPLLDRVDIHLNVPPVAYDNLAARDRQLHRFKQLPGVYANAHMWPRELARILEQLEDKYDGQFRVVFDATRRLMTPPPEPSRQRIGFRGPG